MSLESYAIFGYEWEALEERCKALSLYLRFDSERGEITVRDREKVMMTYYTGGSPLSATMLRRAGEFLTQALRGPV